MDELLAIGEFSAQSGLSAKVLRSYAAAGLLVPAAVDPWSGYRYYAPSQLPEARLILLLRQAEVPLSEIAAFLQDPGPDQLRRWGRDLDLEVAGRRRALDEARAQLSLLAMTADSPPGRNGGTPMTTVTSGSATDRGKVRPTNQDALLVSPPLFAVADGLGEVPRGEVASQLALDTLRARFTAPPSVEALAEAAREAARAVWQRADAEPSLEGMGTTLTAVAVLDGLERTRLAVVNVGDSRAYLFRDGQLSQLTRDHSVVQGLIDAGELPQEQWRTHPKRALLTRALGVTPVVDPDISLPALAGSTRVLVCTDGLTAQADDTQLAAVLSAVADPGQAAAELVQLADRNGGNDNIAVIVIDITPDQPAP
ncbi:MAG TPA: protein phosphatase 2C domain-containing protein [Streptosporangiaceae bacterium]|nr:protein phosphatase 2C domain-containing protein [Streptosporangiaceae bacterium]